ncbi:hypothetical protein H072_6064 [Dactylellina haptotyla CBS 200.50]|uniref:F-box domain-containing protein n=1 Tax=Dactylellina haptotyla (strain CBS 200.50) TaxID=1284197 RepID=S8AG27_DACHA|nr:hypothetical protein H072_6064 [Dactylellina haptotyla CBS 200.50]
MDVELPLGVVDTKSNAFDCLPDELLIEILSHLPTPVLFRSGLSASCLVSKRFNAIATPLLYRHLVLTFGPTTGFGNKNIEALFQLDHSSLKFVRSISIKKTMDLITHTVDSPALERRNRERDNLTRESAAVGSMGALLRCLFQRFNNIDTITFDRCDSYHFLKGDVEYQERFWFPRPSPDLCDELENLTIHWIKRHFRNFLPGWKMCALNHRTLKKLSLICKHSEGMPNPTRSSNRLADVLSQYYIQSAPQNLPSVRLSQVEDLTLKYISNLDDATESFKDILAFENIRVLKMTRYVYSLDFMTAVFPAMHSLTKLSVEVFCEDVDFHTILGNLQCRLQFLRIEYSGNGVVLPSMITFEKHHETLKSLWLDFKTTSDNADNVDDDPDIIKLRILDIPVVKSAAEQTVDLEGLSRFPVLEYLAIPCAVPTTWDAWCPYFPRLKAFYVLNDYGRWSEPGLAQRNDPGSPSADFHPSFVQWFLKSHPAHNESKEKFPSKGLPRVIAFRGNHYANWRGHLTYNSTCAYFRDEEDLSKFNDKHRWLTDIAVWHPDFLEFIDPNI